jgi:Zn-dependent peptidase ImmA (M78 family)
MDNQADYLAGALLMPASGIWTAVRGVFAELEVKPKRLVKGTGALDDYLVSQLPIYISDVFDVSQRAAQVRLNQLGIIANARWSNPDMAFTGALSSEEGGYCR